MNNKQPVRCFAGIAKPHERFWTIQDSTEEPEIEFYGAISEYSWFEDDITPKLFKDDLYSVGKKGPITIRINSEGGDVIAASVIRATILDYPGKVTVKIDSLCASAAVIVALAGDQILMQESAYMVIHDPSTIVLGNIDEIERVLNELRTIKTGIVDCYETKTGLPREKIEKMMTDETWLTGREAMSTGFVDEVITGGSKPKNIGKLTSYAHVPEALLHTEQLPEKTIIDSATERFRAEVQKWLGGH